MSGTSKTSLLIIPAFIATVAAKSFSGKASWNDPWSNNACDGKPKDGSKFITALNKVQYGEGLGNNSPVCGQTLTVTANGKSLEVTVIDMQAGGELGDLDLSKAAFEHFYVRNPLIDVKMSFGQSPSL